MGNLFPIVHIGYPKTGTTWLIKHFYSRVKNYKFVNSEEFENIFFNSAELVVDYAEIKKELSDYLDGKDKFIICNHTIIGTTHSFGLKSYLTREHAYRLKKVLPQSKIIITIRNQPDIIASIYSQYLKLGGTYSLSQFIDTEKYSFFRNPSGFYYSFFEYDKMIRFYHQLFGVENVHVFLYEEFKQDNQAFIDKLINLFNLEINSKSNDINAYENLSLGYLGLRMLRFRNHFSYRNIQKKSYYFHVPGIFWFTEMLKKIQWNGGLKKRPMSAIKTLGTKNFRYISDFYRESNQKLIEEFKLHNIKNNNYPL